MAGPIQSVSFTAASGTSVTVTISATGTGNCLVVYFAAKQSTTTPHISGITLGGAAGNFALAAQELPGGASNEAEIWTDRNAASGQTSVVITWTGGSGVTIGVAGRVEEWPGIITGASPVDKTSTGTGTSAAWSSGSTGTLTQAAEIIVGMVAEPGGSSNTITGPSSPWTNQTQVNDSTVVGMMSGWQQVAATTAQTYSGTLGTSNTWSSVVVSLLQSAPAPHPQGPYLPPRLRRSRAVVRGSAPFLGYVAVPAPRQLPVFPRRLLARAYVRFTPVSGSNVPAVILPLAQTASYDGKTWLKKRWILGGW
jgi:hypothetical protein